jgi:hypothetical protein
MINAKDVLKLTALVLLMLEVYWVLTGHEPHTMSLSTAISSLFGVNSAHEHVETYLSERTTK